MVIAVEVHSPKGFGRVRMRQIPDVSGASLVPFVCDVAEKGSEILTDGWAGYNQLAKCGYGHDVGADRADGAPIRPARPVLEILLDRGHPADELQGSEALDTWTCLSA